MTILGWVPLDRFANYAEEMTRLGGIHRELLQIRALSLLQFYDLAPSQNIDGTRHHITPFMPITEFWKVGWEIWEVAMFLSFSARVQCRSNDRPK